MKLHDKTRIALLEAGAKVFAEAGFRATTVREICRRAGANIAAVNYHFRSKEGLYLEVLRHTQEEAYKKFPPNLGLSADAPAQEKLKVFIRSFLLRIFDEGSGLHHGRIMSRELTDPTAALDSLVTERIKPQADQLAEIVAKLIGQRRSDKHVRFCCFSIVSQCLFYHQCRPVISRLFPEQEFSEQEIERIADHIFTFSLGALRQINGAGKRQRRK